MAPKGTLGEPTRPPLAEDSTPPAGDVDWRDRALVRALEKGIDRLGEEFRRGQAALVEELRHFRRLLGWALWAGALLLGFAVAALVASRGVDPGGAAEAVRGLLGP